MAVNQQNINIITISGNKLISIRVIRDNPLIDELYKHRYNNILIEYLNSHNIRNFYLTNFTLLYENTIVNNISLNDINIINNCYDFTLVIEEQIEVLCFEKKNTTHVINPASARCIYKFLHNFHKYVREYNILFTYEDIHIDFNTLAVNITGWNIKTEKKIFSITTDWEYLTNCGNFYDRGQMFSNIDVSISSTDIIGILYYMGYHDSELSLYKINNDTNKWIKISTFSHVGKFEFLENYLIYFLVDTIRNNVIFFSLETLTILREYTIELLRDPIIVFSSDKQKYIIVKNNEYNIYDTMTSNVIYHIDISINIASTYNINNKTINLYPITIPFRPIILFCCCDSLLLIQTNKKINDKNVFILHDLEINENYIVLITESINIEIIGEKYIILKKINELLIYNLQKWIQNLKETKIDNNLNPDTRILLY